MPLVYFRKKVLQVNSLKNTVICFPYEYMVVTINLHLIYQSAFILHKVKK